MTTFFNILLAATALAATPASAALQTVNFSGTIEYINSDIPSDLAVNDAVTMSVTYDDSFEVEPGIFLIAGPDAALNFTVGSHVFTLTDYFDIDYFEPAIIFDYAGLTGDTEVYFTGHTGSDFLYTGVKLLGSRCPVVGCFELRLDADPLNLYAFGSLTADSTGAVPEPASWAMLIAGFGLTGAAMRRRRRMVDVAA